LVVAGVPNCATETVGAYGADGTGSFADGSTAQEAAGGADVTAAPAAVGTGGCTRRAGVDLADEKRSGGRQRRFAEEILRVEKG
jgi:hypothetical protein